MFKSWAISIFFLLLLIYKISACGHTNLLIRHITISTITVNRIKPSSKSKQLLFCRSKNKVDYMQQLYYGWLNLSNTILRLLKIMQKIRLHLNDNDLSCGAQNLTQKSTGLMSSRRHFIVIMSKRILCKCYCLSLCFFRFSVALLMQCTEVSL